MSQLVNIITRTASRPKGFNKLRESIKAQSYSNIRHIVLYDDDSALKYLSTSDGYEAHKIDKSEVLRRDKGLDPNTGPYFPYNYYLNDAYHLIEKGYIYIIDDDDYLTDRHVIEDLIAVADPDTLVLGRFQMQDGTLIPENNYFGMPPKICHIGGSCAFFHSKWTDYARWDCWKCSDFRVINRLYYSIPTTFYLDRVLKRKNNNGGLGLRKDID